jgi:hypothetical protein
VLIKVKAPINEFLEHLEALKKMPFRCELEGEIKKMSSDHDFVAQLAK